MEVFNNKSLLNKHAFLRLHLHHAAIGSWPCNNKAQKPVNILFTVVECDENDNSFILDIASNKVLQLKKNCSYFLSCNRLLHWKLSSQLKFISIHFNMEFFYGFDIFQNYPECIVLENPCFLENLFILNQTQVELPVICKINTIIYQLTDELWQKHPINSNIDINNWNNYKNVIEYVQKQGNATTKVTHLAKIMNMRSDVFSRKFTNDLGITPKDFIINALLRKASDLLSNPENNVKIVAQKLNFNSEYYFSTFFKKQTGQSPREYKQQYSLNTK